MKFWKLLAIQASAIVAAYLIDSNFADAVGAIGVLILGIWYSLRQLRQTDLRQL